MYVKVFPALVGVRITQKDMEHLTKRVHQTQSKSISEYLRTVIAADREQFEIGGTGR